MRDDDVLDRAFRALADATRRAIWQQLGQQPGLTTAELTAGHRQMTRWSVMKHLAVLRDAGLIETLPDGRSRRHYRNERGVEVIRRWLTGPPEQKP